VANTQHRAHTIYKNAAGKRVPGTTTVSGQLDKSRFLTPWANKLGLQGIDSSSYVDEKAKSGTLAHDMAAHELRLAMGAPLPPIDMAAYTGYEISAAENSFIKWLGWKKAHVIEPVLVEACLVSEAHQYGGQIDCYASIDGRMALIDNKTSKAIYDEHWIQVAGYAIILEELGYPVDEVRILQIGRDESEGFHEEVKTDLSIQKNIFLHLREIYDLQKRIRGGD
jgi:hypothetical protein